MGCTNSREARRDRRRSPAAAAYYRSRSMPVPSSVGSSSRRVSDSNRHIVALTSSTLGSLRLDDDDDGDELMMKVTNDVGKDPNAKSWSEMIESMIPKTPAKTPPEPETINAWELMAGLEESESEAGAERSSEIVSDFDPDVMSNFRKALDQLSPQHQSLLRQSPEPIETRFAGIVKARVTAFQEKIDAKRGRRCPPGGEGRVVVYYTSLRGVRRTYEDCWAARAILQGYGVRVDERDVSMHAGFKNELEEVLGGRGGGGRLPRVFADGVCLGGAEEIRQMHEAGELAEALKGCEAAAVVGKGGGCEGCGGVRFVPCEKCWGSCKVFVEEEEEEQVGWGGFRRCPDCNENGLVKCPFCW